MNKNPEIQFRSPEEIKAYQESRLAEELLYLQNHSRFYQRLFQAHHIDIQQIKTIEDLQQIPVTTKTDLQLHNEDFICVSRDEIIDYVTTSGTLGDPVTFVLTSEDLDRLAYNEYLSFTTTGCSRQDVLQLMTTIDRRFMAGLAYYMGARELGMGVARVGNGIPELQWDTIRRIHPTCGMVVPSFLIKLIEFAEKNHIDYHHCSMQKCVCIGEALRNPDFTLNTLGKRIHEKWDSLQLYSTYASTEMQSSFTECNEFHGGHLQPELIIVEFLDDNNQPVKEGEAGEVEYPGEKMPKLFVDSEKIAWVLTNLLSNAIRYSKENGRVVIGAKHEDGIIEMYVQDFGKGIDPRYHQSIFDRYFRVPGTKVQGSGLGLSISKDFVEAHGGTLTVESELGKGSRFVIRLKG